jgi:hypothetical protein
VRTPSQQDLAVKVGGYQQRIVLDKAFPEGLARRWQGVGESRIPLNRSIGVLHVSSPIINEIPVERDAEYHDASAIDSAGITRCNNRVVILS